MFTLCKECCGIGGECHVCHGLGKIDPTCSAADVLAALGAAYEELWATYAATPRLAPFYKQIESAMQAASLRTALETCQRENWRLLREVAAERNAAIQRAEAAEAELSRLRAALTAVVSKFGPRAHRYGCECEGLDPTRETLTCADVARMARAAIQRG